ELADGWRAMPRAPKARRQVAIDHPRHGSGCRMGLCKRVIKRGYKISCVNEYVTRKMRTGSSVAYAGMLSLSTQSHLKLGCGRRTRSWGRGRLTLGPPKSGRKSGPASVRLSLVRIVT